MYMVSEYWVAESTDISACGDKTEDRAQLKPWTESIFCPAGQKKE